MGSPFLVACLVALRGEFNELAPDRDKTSDGWIGDAAHQQEPSDHNPDETGNTPYEDADSLDEVHAIDVDRDLRRAGWSMERSVQIIVGRHRSGADDRLNYVIFNRRIWAAEWGWSEREYTGSNPHDKHAHFSSRYTTAAESNTRPWGLLEEDDEVDDETRKAIADEVAKRFRIEDKGVMDKLGKDLANPDSGVYKGFRAIVQDVVNGAGGAGQ